MYNVILIDTLLSLRPEAMQQSLQTKYASNHKTCMHKRNATKQTKKT